MSLATDTRKDVAANISENRTQPKQQAAQQKTPKNQEPQERPAQPLGESANKPLGRTEPLNEQQTPTAEALQINQGSSEEQAENLQINQEETHQDVDDTLHMNAPTLNAPGLNPPGKNVKKEDIGKITDPKKERDLERPDLDPIKIKQGDIIDYMMEEWILAGAGWLGGKAAGLAGYGIYRGGLATWDLLESGGRKVKEWHYEGKRKVEAANSRTQNAANANPSEIVGNGDFSPRETCPSDTKSFCDRIQGLLQKSYELNTPSYDKEALKNLAAVAAQGKLNEHKAEVLKMKNGKKMFKALERLQKDIKEKPEKSKELQGSFLLMMETAEETQKSHNYFCANYAAAQMMHQKQKNPETFANMSNKELVNTFGQLQNDGKALYAAELGRINKGTSAYNDTTDLLNESTDALVKANENKEKGLYAEKGKQPENKALDNLNNIASKDRETSEKPKEQTMENTVKKFNQNDADHLTEQKDADNELYAAEASEQVNNQKREKTRHQKEKANQGTQNNFNSKTPRSNSGGR